MMFRAVIGQRERRDSRVSFLAACLTYLGCASLLACLDKPSPTQAVIRGPSTVQFQIIATQARALVAARVVDVKASYLRRDGTAVSVGHASASVDPGVAVQVPVTVDVGTCFSDPLREGDGATC